MKSISHTLRAAALILVAASVFATGCTDDDDSNDAGSDAGGDAAQDSANDVGNDGDAAEDSSGDTDTDPWPTCDTAASSDALIATGRYFMAIEIAAMNGIQVFFAVDVVGGSDSILSIEMYGISPDQTVTDTELIARVCDITVANGEFEISIDTLTVPGVATPIGTPVRLDNFVLNGTINDDGTFCGDVTGALPLLSIDLAGSAFKAVADGDQSSPPESSCEGTVVETWDFIADCPTFVEGTNTFTSANLEREILVDLPEGWDGETEVPLLFVFHGLGGNAEEMVAYSGYDTVAAAGNAIVIYAHGADDSVGEQVHPTEWNYLLPRYGNDNPDVVYFRDVLKCAAEAWMIDEDRIYLSGMSAGGLFSTFLTLTQSDVVAAAAPFSGGFGLAFPETYDNLTPILVSWGGETDTAVSTNFDDLAEALLTQYAAEGRFHVACDHGAGHTWPGAMTAAAWDFLSRFEYGDTTNPFGSELPEVFPDYCTIP